MIYVPRTWPNEKNLRTVLQLAGPVFGQGSRTANFLKSHSTMYLSLYLTHSLREGAVGAWMLDAHCSYLSKQPNPPVPDLT